LKKSLLFIFTLCIVFVALCSCNKFNQNITDATGSKISGVVETPENHKSYSFDSYQDVVQALTQKNSSEYSMLRAEQDDYGTVYQNTLSKFTSADITVAIPQINNNVISLQNNDGYANITLLTSDLYNFPWIWYHCVVNNQKFDVRISYLDAIYNVENSQKTTYTQILKLIAPNAPSPENYPKYESYKSIYEKDLVLKDGVTVTAMISELKDNSKEYVMLYYDGLLIVLYGDCELFVEDFFESFSIVFTTDVSDTND